MSFGKFAFVFYLSLIICNMSLADFILFDDRIDSQQKTEIQYDVPEGCVVTGLGFRAAYDNITTMHCRYHRLLPNGKLGEAKEVHLGSEPNHACEAKVMLPDGWVAVGFGAAGEPEWDVTLLRVWARRLNRDGTLGEIKTFSAGFKPDRGTEREITITESDRILTGAGLRFHQNDIAGIYARSKRILNLDDKARQRLRSFKTRAWVVSGLLYKGLSRLTDDLKSYTVSRLDITIPRELSFFPSANNLESYVWVRTIDFEKIRQIFADAHPFTGIVVDLPNLLYPVPDPNVLLELHKACGAEKLKMSLRLDHRRNPLSAKNIQIVRAMPEDVGLIVPLYEPRIFKQGGKPLDFAVFGKRDIIVEFDLIRHTMGQSRIPDVHIDELPALITEAAVAGARGFIVQVNLFHRELLDGVNSLSLQALHRLADDPFQPTGPLWKELCDAKYGPVAEHASAALKRTAAINDLIFRTFDYPLFWYNATMHSLPEIDARIGHFKQTASSPHAKVVLQGLLEPTDKTIDKASLEKETALWLLQQSIADANQVLKADPTPQTRALVEAMQNLKTIAQFFHSATRAYLLTKLYEIDGAPVTRANVTDALQALDKTAATVTPYSGLGVLVGHTAFVRTIQGSLEYYAERASLPSALRRVQKLSGRLQNEEAAGQLRQIFLSSKFAPHLSKQNKMLSETVSSLKAFGDLSQNIRVLFGGDGRWSIEEVSGRWCWKTDSKGPCIYLDVLGGPLNPPADYILSFEYFDKGDWKIYFHYDSDYPPAQKREYHPVEPLQLTNTSTWKSASFVLTNCRFSSSQNNGADMRVVSGTGACIRNIHLERK